jgi:hypothetical protein
LLHLSIAHRLPRTAPPATSSVPSRLKARCPIHSPCCYLFPAASSAPPYPPSSPPSFDSHFVYSLPPNQTALFPRLHSLNNSPRYPALQHEFSLYPTSPTPLDNASHHPSLHHKITLYLIDTMNATTTTAFIGEPMTHSLATLSPAQLLLLLIDPTTLMLQLGPWLIGAMLECNFSGVLFGSVSSVSRYTSSVRTPLLIPSNLGSAVPVR